MLQCVVVCCSVLQCDAMSYGVLQRVAACCSVLQCVVVCCGVQCVAVCGSVEYSEEQLYWAEFVCCGV